MFPQRSNSLLFDIPYFSFGDTQIDSQILKFLHREAKSAIHHLEICELMHNLCQKDDNVFDSDSSDLNKYYENLTKICFVIAQKIKGRVLICLPDGHVVIDTCKEGNTYENYMEDIISENHNTRICVFEAQHESEGVSYERKFSGTTNQKEIYIAVRLGSLRDNYGTLRLSVVDKSLSDFKNKKKAL